MSHLRYTLIAAVASLILAAAALWIFMPHRGAEHGSVRVVAGGSVPIRATEPSADAATAFPPIGSFDKLTSYERLMAATSRPRDAEWTPGAEARLRREIAPAMTGLALDALSCAQGVCRISGTLDHREGDQDRSVRLLLDGGIQRRFRAEGFVANGDMTIDADSDRRLRFVQYIALPSLIRR